jgi:hypothetical protein
MPIKPNAKEWSILEQTVEDVPTGLTFQFVVVEGGTARYRLRVYGALPGEVREIVFDAEGREAAAGTRVAEPCRASWLSTVS